MPASPIAIGQPCSAVMRPAHGRTTSRRCAPFHSEPEAVADAERAAGAAEHKADQAESVAVRSQ